MCSNLATPKKKVISRIGWYKFEFIRSATQRCVLHSSRIKKIPLHILRSQNFVDLGKYRAFPNFCD